MAVSTETAEPDARVTMSVAQFRKLAALLDHVASLAESDECAFAAPIDGIRFWVPLPYLEAERARHATQLAMAQGRFAY